VGDEREKERKRQVLPVFRFGKKRSQHERPPADKQANEYGMVRRDLKLWSRRVRCQAAKGPAQLIANSALGFTVHPYRSSQGLGPFGVPRKASERSPQAKESDGIRQKSGNRRGRQV